MKVTKAFTFEAAHFLPHVPDGHKCKNMHGHNYRVEITVEGPVWENGFVVDFFEIEKVMAPLLALVDHRVLNHVPGLENPTAELIALWFKDRTAASSVRVYETPDCWAEA